MAVSRVSPLSDERVAWQGKMSDFYCGNVPAGCRVNCVNKLLSHFYGLQEAILLAFQVHILPYLLLLILLNLLSAV